METKGFIDLSVEEEQQIQGGGFSDKEVWRLIGVGTAADTAMVGGALIAVGAVSAAAAPVLVVAAASAVVAGFVYSAFADN